MLAGGGLMFHDWLAQHHKSDGHYSSSIHSADNVTHEYGVESSHIESVPIREVFQGKTVWDGIVEVLDLHGHPKATRLYAWAYETDNSKKPRHVTVLHIGPVTSPLLAVRAAIVEEFRNREAGRRKLGNPDGPNSHAARQRGELCLYVLRPTI